VVYGGNLPFIVLSVVVSDGCVPAHAGGEGLQAKPSTTQQVHAHNRHMYVMLFLSRCQFVDVM
jgi:hypothetical protein